MSDALEQGLEAQAQSLREFGYPDVTADMVREAHQAWRAGDSAKGVIQLFCFKAFDEYPRIFGEPTK
jgi:hypothetical protein